MDSERNYSDNKESKEKHECTNIAIDDMEFSEELSSKVECIQENKLQETEDQIIIRKAMLDHLSETGVVFFKSLKDDVNELDKQTKIDIAQEVLDRSYGLFLAKFGNHLLKEHLLYFENRSDEESLIVDIYLKQLTRELEKQSAIRQTTKIKPEVPAVDEMDVAIEASPDEQSRLSLRNKLLDHLSLSKDAHFKSQQVGDPDLNQQEKREIAEELLDHDVSVFLSRFGTYLLEEHLSYFDYKKSCDKSYEIDYHLKHLRKTHCKVVTKVGIKNRRFEALKQMVEEGSYFCETEMRNRNPLLYEQLVGRFLTSDERRERLNNVDTTNITFVNLLLEQMDREAVKKLREEQEEAEEDAMENDDDFSDDKMEEENDSEEDNDLDKSLWGEEYTDNNISGSKTKEEKKTQEKRVEEDIPELSDAEKRLLMDEFRSNMFSSFLQGKDKDFDYSKVDYNSDYDDLEVQGQDEEDKYFDEESSQDGSTHKFTDEEDLLDQYMARLRPDHIPFQLVDQMHALTHEET